MMVLISTQLMATDGVIILAVISWLSVYIIYEVTQELAKLLFKYGMLKILLKRLLIRLVILKSYLAGVLMVS